MTIKEKNVRKERRAADGAGTMSVSVRETKGYVSKLQKEQR